MQGEIVADRYKIEAPLGLGGVAEVVRAVDLRSGAQVAIKTLLRQHARDALMRARFLREAALSRTLTHPNILPVIDAGDAHGAPFIVMPLAEGGSLEDVLAAQGFEPAPPLARIVARSILRALAHAHAAGVIHRDIKPHNVLIRRRADLVLLTEDDFVLSDFGMARVQSLATMTGSSLQWGSPHYMAPELLRGEPAEPRSDLYALGVLMYEVMTGVRPWGSDAPLARLRPQQIAPPDTDDFELDELVMALLAWEPRHRPSSAQAALDVVDRVRPLPRRSQEIVCDKCSTRRPATTSYCFACGTQDSVPVPTTKGPWHVLLRRMEVEPDRLERLHGLLARFSGDNDVSLQVVQTPQELNEFPKGSASTLPVSLFAGLDEPAARQIALSFTAAGFDVIAAKPWFKHKALVVAAQICGAASLLGGVWALGIHHKAMMFVFYGLTPGALLVQHWWARHTKRLIQPRPPMLQLRAAPLASPAMLALQERMAALVAAAVPARVQDVVSEIGAAMIRISGPLLAPDAAEVAQAQAQEWAQQTLQWLEAVLAKLCQLERALAERSDADLVRDYAKAERQLKQATIASQTRSTHDLAAALAHRHDLEDERDRTRAELHRVLNDLEAAAGTVESRPIRG